MNERFRNGYAFAIGSTLVWGAWSVLADMALSDVASAGLRSVHGASVAGSLLVAVAMAAAAINGLLEWCSAAPVQPAPAHSCSFCSAIEGTDDEERSRVLHRIIRSRSAFARMSIAASTGGE